LIAVIYLIMICSSNPEVVSNACRPTMGKQTGSCLRKRQTDRTRIIQMCGLLLYFRPGTVKSESSFNWDTILGGFEIRSSAYGEDYGTLRWFGPEGLFLNLCQTQYQSQTKPLTSKQTGMFIPISSCAGPERSQRFERSSDTMCNNQKPVTRNWNTDSVKNLNCTYLNCGWWFCWCCRGCFDPVSGRPIPPNQIEQT